MEFVILKSIFSSMARELNQLSWKITFLSGKVIIPRLNNTREIDTDAVYWIPERKISSLKGSRLSVWLWIGYASTSLHLFCTSRVIVKTRKLLSARPGWCQWGRCTCRYCFMSTRTLTTIYWWTRLSCCRTEWCDLFMNLMIKLTWLLTRLVDILVVL